MMRHCDVVVVGGGVMGAAAAWVLAGRGRRVVLIERFEPGHARGSSHGTARIFRLGYAESDYIDLGRRSMPLWCALEGGTGATLLELTGALDHGPVHAIQPLADAMTVAGVVHRMIDPAEAAARWRGIRFDEAVLHHDDGGRVYAQRTLDVLHEAARGLGADLRFATTVTRVEACGERETVVHLADGERLVAERVVVTVGAWAARVLDGVVDLPPLKVSCENPMHFRVRDLGAGPFIPLIHRGRHDIYSMTTPGEGVKVAEHYRDEWVDPDDRPFDIDPASAARLGAYISDWLPALDPTPVSSTRCLYTTTPSKDFVLDRVGPVVVGAGFSGHGFKFAPAIGEVLADLAEGGTQEVGRFRLGSSWPVVHPGVK